MREKLIELISDNGTVLAEGDYGEVADHLLANGVIVLPCKVGETLWYVRGEKIYTVEVAAIRPFITERTMEFRVSAKWKREDPFFRNGRLETIIVSEDIGKTVFLTREAAEAALRKEGQG